MSAFRADETRFPVEPRARRRATENLIIILAHRYERITRDAVHRCKVNHSFECPSENRLDHLPNLPSSGVIIEHLRDRVLWKIACVWKSRRRHDRRRGEDAIRGFTDCQPGIPAVRCAHREEWVLRRRVG